ncbi:MAG: hypothetical protein V7700_11150 [Halioglobus sp.]
MSSPQSIGNNPQLLPGMLRVVQTKAAKPLLKHKIHAVPSIIHLVLKSYATLTAVSLLLMQIKFYRLSALSEF